MFPFSTCAQGLTAVPIQPRLFRDIQSNKVKSNAEHISQWNLLYILAGMVNLLGRQKVHGFFQSVPPFYALYFVFSTMHIANSVDIYFFGMNVIHICVCFGNIFLTIKALRSQYYDPNVGGALFQTATFVHSLIKNPRNRKIQKIAKYISIIQLQK